MPLNQIQIQNILFTRKKLLAAIICCNSLFASAQQPLFQIVPSKQTAIHFSNNINENESLNVLSYEYFYNGGGVAVGDFNNDGLEDLFFTGNMSLNKLYLNQGSLKFKDITKNTKGLEGRLDGWKTGVTLADVNGDGFLDIYVCYSGKNDSEKRKNQLFINNGNLTFTEKAAEYGLDDSGFSTQAAFLDFDRDGDLDMMLINHNTKKIDNMEFANVRNQTDENASNKLFENDNGHFTEVSKKAGIVQNPLTFGLGLAIADMNKDGWPDIYVTNDYNEPDYLYLNNHDGTFSEQSKKYFRHMSHFSMGVDIADFNNDGLPDVLTLDMLPEDNHRQKSLQMEENYETFELMLKQDLYKQYMCNMLQLNNGNGTFSEIAQMSGVSATDWSWCPLIADFDNDGFKDIFISNGYLRDYTNKDFLRYWGDYKLKKAMAREPFLLMDLIKAMPSTKLPNYIYSNNHDLTFSNKQKEWGMNNVSISNGSVYADLDNDGDLDLVVNNINEEASIYQNTSQENHHNAFLSVKLNGQGKNKNAIGAKVSLFNKGTKQYQEVNPGRGYLSCVSSKLTFGLGSSTTIDSVEVIWPDGKLQLLKDVKANQHLVINYKPESAESNTSKSSTSLFTKIKTPIDYQIPRNTVNDFKRQPLMLFMYSKTAPIIIKGDVNKDGLEDIFVAGDESNPAKMMMQQKDGSFKSTELDRGSSTSTTAAALFFDANGDGSLDLYLAKGGYSLYEPNTADLQDQLFLNDGKGTFSPAPLPKLNENSKSCIRACDYDGDGDLDLFVGGRVIPGQYPSNPTSYLLVNNGKGVFSIASTPFSLVGMVTDGQWIDLNEDGRKDLVMCGEMMPIKVYLNTKTGFEDQTSKYFNTPAYGLWNVLNFADLDGDGSPDLVAGNLGLNTPIKASEKQPAELFYSDFDGNGSIDPFFNFYVQGSSYPFVSRDEINDQIYPMRKKFGSYLAYSNTTMKDLFTAEQIEKSGKLMANTLLTTCFLNKNGVFSPVMLPEQANLSMVTQILSKDYNHDGKPDLLLLGNHSDNRLKLGCMDANYGCLLIGNGKGSFTYVDQSTSGLSIIGDVKSAFEMNINNSNLLVVGVDNEPIQFYKIP
jgi:hypothetical protein